MGPNHISSDGAVELDAVTVEFDRHGTGEANRVLDGVSLEVHDGEFLVLVGRSGCGKTTILNLLAGLIRNFTGRVGILGRTPAEARDDVAYMFARDALLPWRSAVRNVQFGLEIRHPEMPRRKRRERALQYLDLVGLRASAGLYPWQLSQGMRQRVALARTWALDPKVLLMDEPFAALDAQTRGDVQRKFLDLWAGDRKSVVFVTHDLTEAILMADRIVLLAEGRIAAEHIVDISRPRNVDEITLDPTYRRIYKDLVDALHAPAENSEQVPA